MRQEMASTAAAGVDAKKWLEGSQDLRGRVVSGGGPARARSGERKSWRPGSGGDIERPLANPSFPPLRSAMCTAGVSSTARRTPFRGYLGTTAVSRCRRV